MAADAASRKKSIEELLFNGGRNDDDETSGVDSTPNVSDSDLRTLSAKKSPRRGRDGSADSRDRELKRKSSAKYARRRSLSQNARGRSLPPTSAETVRASRDALAKDRETLKISTQRRSSIKPAAPPKARRTAEPRQRASAAAAGDKPSVAAAASSHVSVVLVGARRTGKTLMAQTYAHGVAALRPPPTLGVERHVAAMPRELGGNARLPELRVWDTSGDSRFDDASSNLVRAANAILVLYARGDAASFESAANRLLRTKVECPRGAVVCLVASTLGRDSERGAVDVVRRSQVRRMSVVDLGDLGVPYDAADRVVRAAASTPSLEPQAARGIHPATCCPLTGRVMRDPVVAACGNSFELEAIAHWLARNETSPVTQEKLASKLLFPNAALRSIIRAGHRP